MKRVTIEDVAKVAGVSRQTVSRAINDKSEISQETKERVLATVEDLGYQPNRLAQGMVTQRTRTVGLVVPDIANPFFPEVARGVQDIAQNENYNVFLCNSDDSAEIETKLLRSLAAQGVDGIITMGSKSNDQALLDFAKQYRPIVMINRFFEHPNVNQLIVDNFHGAQLAVEYFISKNRTTIGMLTNEDFTMSQVRRVQGFKESMRQHGLPLADNQIVQSQPTLEGGYQATKQFLTQRRDIDAIFTYNDLMGLGSIRACCDLGLNVPNDVAIIGFDDIQLASMVSPSLSSIRVDKYAIGKKAMERLLAMLENPETVYPTFNMDVELILRESTPK